MTLKLITPAKVNMRALAALSRFAANEETRYYLNGVKVEIEPRAVTYVATDGHRLLVRREEKLSDREVHPDNDMTGEFIIPTAQCKAFKAKKGENSEADLYGAMDEMTLKRGHLGVVFQPIDGTFPDWRKVIPHGPLAQGIGQFRGDYAASFLKASEELELGLPVIAHNGSAGPAIVRFSNDSDTLGVIMPFRADDARMKPLPVWLEPSRAAAE